MKKYLIRIGLVALLLCSVFLGSALQLVKTHQDVAGRPQDEQLVRQYDNWVLQVAEEPDWAPVPSLSSSSSSSRIASSRPVRLLPTYGGKPHSHFGRWAKNQSSNFLNCFLQQPYMRLYRLYTAVASPRRYYVIALRRLLC
ncbi:MAG: hypothetical protein K6B13_01150 [Prevotella sp.]|nr:hypothetical protein [Prevotella sp.]